MYSQCSESAEPSEVTEDIKSDGVINELVTTVDSSSQDKDDTSLDNHDSSEPENSDPETEDLLGPPVSHDQSHDPLGPVDNDLELLTDSITNVRILNICFLTFIVIL